jgi:uncharacterized protein (DUF952 family)
MGAALACKHMLQHGPKMITPHPMTAYKILTAAEWAQFQAEGIFHGAPVDLADGYVHLSAAGQLQGTLDKHFAGQTGLVIAEVDLAALGDTVKWEVSRGGALFPHVYGPLPMAAVLGVRGVDQG